MLVTEAISCTGRSGSVYLLFYEIKARVENISEIAVIGSCHPQFGLIYWEKLHLTDMVFVPFLILIEVL